MTSKVSPRTSDFSQSHERYINWVRVLYYLIINTLNNLPFKYINNKNNKALHGHINANPTTTTNEQK